MPASYAKRWVFTLNNYTQNDVARLRNLDGGVFCYLVFGREIGASGTPHLQGFCHFRTRKRLRQVRELISPRAHFEVARGSDGSNRTYCIKDGDYEERGESPSSDGGPQGRRSDIDAFRDWVIAFHATHERQPAESDIASSFPALYLRYRRNLLSLSSYLLPSVSFGNGGDLNDWQSELYERLEEEPDDRQITFIVDEEGGKGKSWFIRYCVSHHPELVQPLSIGKRDDIAHAIDVSKKWFLFNIPRGGMEHLQYTILEQLKDRVVFSPKYNSETKLIRHRVHVVVFCNEAPNYEKMSSDRYHVVDLL